MTLPTFQPRNPVKSFLGKTERIETQRCRACGCVGQIDDVSELDREYWRVWVLGGALLKAHLEDLGR